MLETSALETLYAYGEEFTLSTHFIITNFKSLHKLKTVRNLLFISYNFFFHSIRCLNFSIDLKIKAGLARRRTFRLVTYSSPTIVCVVGMLYLDRKKHNVIRKKENITDFLDPIFQSFTIS